MKPTSQCAPCLLNWVCERSGILVGEEGRLRLTKTLLGILSREFDSKANVASLSNKLTSAIQDYLPQSSKFYQRLKRKNNQLAKNLLGRAKNYVESGGTLRQKFERACHLASVSNVAPINAPRQAFAFQEVRSVLRGRRPFPTMIGPLFESAREASHVLYVTDNAGEIGFDSLLISILKEMGSKVTLVVKQGLFFEDATIEDASFFALDMLADDVLTSKEFFVPRDSPSSLMDAFRESDLIIAKGTGNYEALADEILAKRIIYMLKIKCDTIAGRVGVDLGNFIVKVDK